MAVEGFIVKNMAWKIESFAESSIAMLPQQLTHWLTESLTEWPSKRYADIQFSKDVQDRFAC